MTSNDFPPAFAKTLREAQPEGNFRYTLAAGLVLATYLEKHCMQNVDNFLSRDGTFSTEFTTKLLGIAETLFLLRDAPGFPEMCRRMRTRDLRSTFFELFAARDMMARGYVVDAWPETRNKGSDFDFCATRSGITANVKVTALKAADFSAKSLRYALNKKRRQLPDDKPGIIYFAYPESWFPAEIDHLIYLREPLDDFLKGTRRVNAIIMISEAHITATDDPEFGSWHVMRQVATNGRPRIEVDLDLYDDLPNFDISEFHGTKQTMNQKFDQWRSPFRDYVDSICNS